MRKKKISVACMICAITIIAVILTILVVKDHNANKTNTDYGDRSVLLEFRIYTTDKGDYYFQVEESLSLIGGYNYSITSCSYFDDEPDKVFTTSLTKSETIELMSLADKIRGSINKIRKLVRHETIYPDGWTPPTRRGDSISYTAPPGTRYIEYKERYYSDLYYDGMFYLNILCDADGHNEVWDLFERLLELAPTSNKFGVERDYGTKDGE